VSAENWMTLQYRSFFYRTLVFETDIPDFPVCKFSYVNGETRVKGDERLAVYYAGGKAIESNGSIFKVVFKKNEKGTRGRINLESKDFSVVFNDDVKVASERCRLFSLAGATQKGCRERYIEISCSRNDKERYLLSLRKHSLTPRVEIKSLGEGCDAQLMLTCLVYQWTEEENYRRFVRST
jgi:hypothetical protein